MLDIGAEAALVQGDRLAGFRMRPDRLGGAALLGGQQIHRAIHADAQHILILGDVHIGRAALHIRPETANPGGDRLARFRIAADLARQRQQRQRALQLDIAGRDALGQGDTLGLLFLAHRLAKLDIIAVGAFAHGDRQAGAGIAPQFPRAAIGQAALGAVAIGRDCQRSRIAAFGIVRAADEAAIAAQLQAQPAGAAGRAGAGIFAVFRLGEEMRPQIGVQRIQHLGDGQILGAIDGAVEMVPEIAQHLLVVDPPAGDVVELVFQLGGEIVLDVTLEEVRQEGGDHPAAILRHEAPFVETHIVPVLQHLQDAGIGGGAADAQLLQLLHQAGLGIARRRLGEMLVRRDRAETHRVALGHRRQQAAFIILGRFVTAFLVQRQEAIEGDDGAGGAQRDRAVGRRDVCRRLVQQGAFHLAGDGALPDQLV